MRVCVFDATVGRRVTCPRASPRAMECSSPELEPGAMVFVKCEAEEYAGQAAGGPPEPAGPVGQLVDMSQADDRRIIALVRARPLLYARTNLPVATYHAEVKTLWREVADAMGWTVAAARRKWGHIRNSFSRHLRNEVCGARTGRGRAVSRWYLAPELAFLRPHMHTDTRAPVPVSLVAAAEALGAAAAGGAGVLEDGARADEESYLHFFRGLYEDYRELGARRQRRFRRQCLVFLHRLLDPPAPAPADTIT